MGSIDRERDAIESLRRADGTRRTGEALSRGIHRRTLYELRASITLEPGFTQDVSNIGHYGTGDLRVSLRSSEDLERAKPLLQKSYEVS